MSTERELREFEEVPAEVVSIASRGGATDFRDLRRTSAMDSVTEDFRWHYKDNTPPLVLKIRPYAIDEPTFERIQTMIQEGTREQESIDAQIGKLNVRLGELRGDLQIAELDEGDTDAIIGLRKKIASFEATLDSLKKKRPVLEVVAREFFCRAVASWGLEDKGQPLPVSVETVVMLVNDPDIGETRIANLQRELISFFSQVIKERKSGKRK